MSVNQSGGHPDMDYPQHRATYAGFIKGMQISVALLVITMIGMAIFVA